MEDFRLYRWLDACLQPASIIAIVLLPIVWGVVFYELAQDRKRSDEVGLRLTASMSRLMENYTYRMIKRTDDALTALQSSYPDDPGEAGLQSWVARASTSVGTARIRFVDAAGVVRASNRGAVAPVDQSDRAYFRHLAAVNYNELYLSPPFTPRVTGATSLRLARRITHKDGSFAGVVVASLDHDFIDSFYESLDVAIHPTIALIGFDGALRTARGPDVRTDGITFHTPLVGPRLMSEMQTSGAGIYWTQPPLSGNAAHVVAYRAVEDYPFYVVAAMPEADVFAGYFRSEKTYLVTGWSITIALMVALFVATSRELKVKAAANTLAGTNARFEASLSNMPHGLSMFDHKQNLVISNARYAEMYRLPAELTAPGATLQAILEARVRTGTSPADGESFIHACLRDVDRGEAGQQITELRDGRTIAIDFQPMDGGGFVAVHQDITQQKASEARIAYLAHHDPLTGLLSRASLIEKIDEYLARARRNGEHFALLLLDLDRFKQVNDSHGHPAGDVLLQQVAARLKSELRQTDVLARLGGDEFAIIQAAETDPHAAACGLAARLTEVIARPFGIDRSEVSIGTSIGIAISNEQVTAAGRLMKMADLALYQTKGQGRNNFSFFTDSLEEAANVRNALETDLRHAVARSDFMLHYQPILNARTGLVDGAEALIRWPHPTQGWVGPDRFIPLAEECGLIGEIGQWVLRTACREAAGWPVRTKVAVNISAVQLRDPMIVDYVICALAESGLPPERLELEITETALIDRGVECLDILRQFKALGVTIALDDFGTGYSSLSQLTMFPFDKIKIDKSFTSRMTSRADCAAIIAGVLALAHSLEIATTAEGVETWQQYQLLKLAGVSSLQGYLIKRPGPAAELDFETPFVRKESARVA
jgi:diguanylate cyclase (GGDEF)-like protein